jgi:hypothetical protein
MIIAPDSGLPAYFALEFPHSAIELAMLLDYRRRSLGIDQKLILCGWITPKPASLFQQNSAVAAFTQAKHCSA